MDNYEDDNRFTDLEYLFINKTLRFMVPVGGIGLQHIKNQSICLRKTI